MSTEKLDNLKNDQDKKIRYFLATASSRFFARAIDYLILVVALFLLFVIVFGVGNTTWMFWTEDFLTNSPSWKYFLFALISFGLLFLYFICLPIWWNGKTVGLWTFKLMIVNTHITNKFIWGLIKRECLIWGLFSLLSIVLGSVLFAYGTNAYDLIKSMMNLKKTSGDYQIIATVFDAFYFISGIIVFILLIVMFVKSKRRCIQDFISDTVTIRLNGFSDKSNDVINAKTKTSTKNYKLPGEVESIDFEEIDKD